ncbi:MAG: hypothetical protein ABW046_13350 [Actinoplanes sp.]
MGDFEAAGDAMREEAKSWDAYADAMAQVHVQFALLGLTPAAFSVLDPPAAPAAGDLHEAYTRMHDRLGRLFGEATEELDRMARALRVSAEKYEESDRGAAGRVQGVW